MNSSKIPISKKKLDVLIISDVHLGTFGCHAEELLLYLKTVDPKVLILNGDIIDIWQFNKNYFPKSHQDVLRKILKMSQKNTRVVYLTGNHDEKIRDFVPLKFGKIEFLNKIVLHLECGKVWIFHGDIFDLTLQHSKWLAKLGGLGYDLLILLNRLINFFLVLFKKDKFSFSKKIKDSVKSAMKFISDFEKTASDIAISNNYNFVVCGHIHQPKIETINNTKGNTTYMNCGDWVENLTSLEYVDNKWSIYSYNQSESKNSKE